MTFFVEDDAQGEPCVWRSNDDHPFPLLRKLSLPDDLWQLIVDAIKAPAVYVPPPQPDPNEFCTVACDHEHGLHVPFYRVAEPAVPPSPAASAVTEQGEALREAPEHESYQSAYEFERLVSLPAALLDEIQIAAFEAVPLLSDYWPTEDKLKTQRRLSTARRALIEARRSASLSESVPEETPNHEH